MTTSDVYICMLRKDVGIIAKNITNGPFQVAAQNVRNRQKTLPFGKF
jgi:hypothetical protein